MSDYDEFEDGAPEVCDSCGIALFRCECEMGAIERSWKRLEDDD